MDKLIIAISTIALTLLASQSVQVLFSDTVTLTTDLSIATSEVSFEIEDIQGKPIDAVGLVPGEWSEVGSFKLTNSPNSMPIKTYLHIKNMDEKICGYLNIKVEAEYNNSRYIVYDGELEKLNGENDSIELTVSELDFLNPNEELTVYQQIQLDGEANKNTQGESCIWDEFIVGKGNEFNKEHRINRNKLSAGYWVAPEVEVKDPNQNKELLAEEKFTIKWKAKSVTHDPDDLMLVDIYLVKQDDDSEEIIVENLEVITKDEENDSKYDWVPSTENIGDNYLIKVVVTDGHELVGEDISDKIFEILAN